MLCRWTVTSIRAYAANMVFKDTQQFSGFLKVLWNPKSEFKLCMVHLKFCFLLTLSIFAECNKI